jgi:hypothetical protein
MDVSLSPKSQINLMTTCPKCGHPTSDMQRNGGKARWAGVSAADRSAAMRKAVAARWAKKKAKA